jgi:hypothetical protein
MFECAVVGDSIALGVGTELQRCVVDAKIGLPSAEIVGRVLHAHVLVVSAGSNDANNPLLEANLRIIRARATGRVIWISPIDPVAAAAVMRVARLHGDKVVHFAPRPDNIHPKSYGVLAGRVDAVMREPSFPRGEGA